MSAPQHLTSRGFSRQARAVHAALAACASVLLVFLFAGQEISLIWKLAIALVLSQFFKLVIGLMHTGIARLIGRYRSN
jgi:hypothetical protein